MKIKINSVLINSKIKKMRKISILFLAIITLASCAQSFKKGKGGLEYKIIANGSGATVKPGEFLELNIREFVNNGGDDSTIYDSRNMGSPSVIPFDSTSVPPEYFSIISQLRKGDSMVTRNSFENLKKTNPMGVPPYLRKGGFDYVCIKVVNIYHTEAEANKVIDANLKKMQLEQEKKDKISIAKDNQTLDSLFKKNNIAPQKGELGTFVEIIEPGNGANIDTNVVVQVKYKGRTIDGNIFDTNMDTTKGHTDPISVNMTGDMTLGAPMIRGWIDGLKLLKNGSKARFYIPSALGYGSRGAGKMIPPNSILIFDIEIVKIKTRAEQKAEIESYQLKQKIKTDSLMNSRKAKEGEEK